MLLGKRPPNRDELHTIFHEAASIMNNTSLYEISSDPNDDLPVCPATLLTMKSSPNPPPLENFTENDIMAYGRRRWRRRVQAVADDFWHRWKTEYLQELQRRQKWTKRSTNIQEGDVVLLKSKNAR